MNSIELGPTSQDWLPEIASYQDRVKWLHSENQRLGQALQVEQGQRRCEVQKLRAQLNEALSPELLALRRELRKWRTRAHAAEGRIAAMLREGVR